MSTDRARASFTATQAGWYDCSVWPPRKISDDEVAAHKPRVPPDAVYITFDSEPFTGFASDPAGRAGSPPAG